MFPQLILNRCHIDETCMKYMLKELTIGKKVSIITIHANDNEHDTVPITSCKIHYISIILLKTHSASC
jgi:hypothetical protein